MSVNYKCFPDVMGKIVSLTRLTIDPSNGILPIYEYGTYLELTKENALKDRVKQQKYPLVWLVWGDGDNVENWSIGGKYTVNARIFIIGLSKPDYKSEERMSLVIKSVLYPILDEMKKQMMDSSLIDITTSQGFNKQDHLFWGQGIWASKQRTTFGDFLDAIEINFNNLEILPNNC